MFKILSNKVTNQFTIKKSRFLTFGFFVDNKDSIKDILDKLRKECPDASHICYGYILDDNTYYYLDNGEPSGTAGLPIYSAIKSLHINYCLFVVIRYFGGIKFGPVPLRQTFKDVTLQTLKAAKLIDAYSADIVKIDVGYDILGKVKQTLSKLIVSIDYGKEVATISLGGSKDNLLKTIDRLDLKPTSIELNKIIKK